MKTKTIMSSYHTFIKMTKIKNTDNTTYWHNAEEQELLYTTDGKKHSYYLFGKTFGSKYSSYIMPTLRTYNPNPSYTY